MSTSYYRMRPPVTDVRVEQGAAYSTVQIWLSHALAGKMTVRDEELKDFLRLLFDNQQDDLRCAAHAYFGGDERGCVVTLNEPVLPDDAKVLSEYGELETIGSVRAWAGRGAKSRR